MLSFLPDDFANLPHVIISFYSWKNRSLEGFVILPSLAQISMQKEREEGTAKVLYFTLKTHV